jgi:WD40 repeat protein
MSAMPVVLEGNNDGINSVAFSPDNRWLAVASYGNLVYDGNELHSDNTVHLWRFKEPFSKHIDLKMGDEAIRQIAFSPDGKWLALDYNLRNMENPSKPLESTPFFSIFSPDSQWLADAGPPSIWNINSPNSEPILLSSGEGYAGPVAFSPDGQRLGISNSENISVWNLNYDTLMETACHVVGRNFSRAEWNRYFPNEEYRKTCDQWEPEATLTPTP